MTPAANGPVAEEISERRRDATRVRIIDVAAERLAEHGYTATSLSDVALLAELEAAMVRFHFPAKEDLVDAVLKAGIDHARAEIGMDLAELPTSANGADRLAAAMSAYLRAISAQQHVTRANIRCYRDVPPVVRRGLAVHMREFVEIWTELLEAGEADHSIQAGLDVGLAGRVLIAALNSTVTQLSPENLERITDQVVSTILGGLRAR